MVVELAVLALVLAVIGSILYSTVVTGMAPMPTLPRVRAALLAALPEDLEGTVFELGSGWGTLAFPLARRYPRCPVVALEVSLVPWLVSRLRRLAEPLPNLDLRRADFHRADLSGAALVVCYLHPQGMERLKGKLEAELPPGALVLSNFFAFHGWSAESVRTLDDLHATRIYLYRMPPAERPMGTD